jgi:hypothetical protein
VRNKIFGKGLVLTIVVLFVCMSVVPSSGITIKNSEILEINKENKILVNHPLPQIPSNPTPYDGETDVPINEIYLHWDGYLLRNDVYFGKSSPPPLVAKNLSGNRYDPGLMDTNTTYYWQIVAKDYAGASTPGPIWNFTTGSRINHPPNPPEITVKLYGSFSFIYIKVTDPDGDDLKSYGIVYDKNQFGFVFEGNWANGTVIENYGPGYGRGWHVITANCMDRYYVWGEDGYLEFTIPRNRAQSIQQPLRSLFSQQINQLLQNLILHHQIRYM